jgi:putative membrane protein
MKPSLSIFIKGILIGIANIIPGVSGGTLALITGIYERLIFALSEIDSRFLKIRNKEGLKNNLDRIDLPLLIPLGLGIISAFLIFSGILESLLKTYPGPTYGFFFGLIIASVYFVYKQINTRFNSSTIISSIVGFIFAFWLVGLTTTAVPHSLIAIFLSGVVAIVAMILPGLSGSFILLILGQYEYIIGAISELNLLVIFVFGLGAIVGLLSTVKIIAYLFKRWEAPTLSFLIGLMLGGLRLPYQNMIGNNILVILVPAVLGFVIVLFLENHSG